MAGKAGGGPEPELDFAPGSALAGRGPGAVGRARRGRESPPALPHCRGAETRREGRRVGPRPRRPARSAAPQLLACPPPRRLYRKSRLRPPRPPPIGLGAGSRRGLAAGRREPWAASASPCWGTLWRPAPKPGWRGRRGGERRGGRRDFRHGTRKGPRRRWWEL